MSEQTKPIAAPYGTWKSPITAEAITKNANSIEEILVDSVTSAVYHLERRPSEGGRTVLVETKTGEDVVGSGWNVRTGVQEYGGSPALVHNGILYFSHYTDGRIYRVKVVGGEEPEAITPEGKPYRYANLALHPIYSDEYLVAVLEDHTEDTPATVVTTLALIDVKAKAILTNTLVSGADFYALPRFSPNGKQLAWLQWFHPDMPWQGGEIYVADILLTPGSGGRVLALANTKHVAGKRGAVSAGYPGWKDDKTLLFTSDQSRFVNPWKFKLGQDDSAGDASSPLLPSPVNQDFAQPFWILGEFPYALVKDGVLFVAIKDGRDVLYLLQPGTSQQPKPISTPYVTIESLRTVSLSDDTVVFAGQKADEKKSIVQVSVSALIVGSAEYTVLNSLKSATNVDLPKELVSVPQPITLDLPNNEGPLHVVFYGPHNPAYKGTSIEGEKPPVVVNVHGGPTGYVGQGLDWRKQYFTSRGWAWVDVNYRGSSGYGRDYIERLNSNWGIVDVYDCINTVRLLASPSYSLIDPARATIRGGSAGGYTVLAALSTPAKEADRKVFAAAQSSYGVSDLKKLEEFTHKFESQYLNRLLGGTSQEVPEVYKERSPINNVEKIESPLLILQGEIDKVVPKEQAELIYEGIKARGGVVEYKLYPGEGHGWRKEENLKDSLERELDFYERILKLKASA